MAAKKNLRNNKETTLRHVWLAAIGAAVVARREARTAVEIAGDEAGRLRERAARFSADAQAVARGMWMTVRERIEPTAGQLAIDVQERLAPVLTRFGLAPRTRRTVRKTRRPAAKTMRRGPRPVVKKVKNSRR